MKKSRKLFTGLLCTIMAFSSALPVYAVEERGSAARCPKCTTGAVSSHEISRVYNGMDFKPCSHGNGTFDKYYKYLVTVELNCSNCSFTDTDSYDSIVYIECC